MKELIAALLTAKSQFEPVMQNGYNPHFKNHYSTIEDLLAATKPALEKNGLVILQYIDSDSTSNFLVTRLMHVSGQEIPSRVLLSLKDASNPQQLGSGASYVTRYAYKTICGIATIEEDDDGNSAAAVAQPRPQNGVPIGDRSEFISPKQLGLLLGKIKESGNPSLQDQICKRYGILNLNQFPWRKFNEVLTLFNPAPVAVQSANANDFSPEDLEELPFQ